LTNISLFLHFFYSPKLKGIKSQQLLRFIAIRRSFDFEEDEDQCFNESLFSREFVVVSSKTPLKLLLSSQSRPFCRRNDFIIREK